MGRVIAFSEFGEYLEDEKQNANFVPATILDSNILISLFYEMKDPAGEVQDFLEIFLEKNGISCFATINTQFEFLDFLRRLLMTEYLRDAVDEHSDILLTARSRAVIQSVSGRLAQRERRGGDPVFNDSDLKEVKKAFSAGKHSGFNGWLLHCEAALANKLERADEFLKEINVAYISPSRESQQSYFHKKLEWNGARIISEKTCLGLSDAMILNALQCSRFSFVVSLDFDLGYAVLAAKEMKDIVMPDSIAREYRNFHF